jgi:hypothetical protein
VSSIGLLTLGLVGKEVVDLGDGSVERADTESVVGNVHDQVLAHDGQTDEAHITGTTTYALLADMPSTIGAQKVSHHDMATWIGGAP